VTAERGGSEADATAIRGVYGGVREPKKPFGGRERRLRSPRGLAILQLVGDALADRRELVELARDRGLVDFLRTGAKLGGLGAEIIGIIHCRLRSKGASNQTNTIVKPAALVAGMGPAAKARVCREIEARTAAS